MDMSNWRKVIVLRPIGPSDASFSMGFVDHMGFTVATNGQRRVSDGPFGMKIGFMDRDFFIATHDNCELKLAISELTNGGYVEIY